MWFGFYTNFVIISTFTYFYGFYVALGTRDLIFNHMGIPGLPFAIYILFWAELRKYLVNHLFDVRFEIGGQITF